MLQTVPMLIFIYPYSFPFSASVYIYMYILYVSLYTHTHWDIFPLVQVFNTDYKTSNIQMMILKFTAYVSFIHTLEGKLRNKCDYTWVPNRLYMNANSGLNLSTPQINIINFKAIFTTQISYGNTPLKLLPAKLLFTTAQESSNSLKGSISNQPGFGCSISS